MSETINPNQMTCKYCHSQNVIKFGKYKETQYYYCNNCDHKFSNADAIPKMQYATSKVADALNMYYEGMSLNKIRRNFIQQHNDYPSDVTILNWVERFSKLAIKEAEKYKPNVGGVWCADETMIDLDGKKVWFWDMIDTKTRFLVASHMSNTRTTKDAEALMKQAYERTGKIPRIIFTDKLRAYLDGIEITFGADTQHKQGSPFDVKNNTNFIERFHSTLKSRTEIMRGLHTMKTARLFLDGWLVHYNFFRPHMSLNDMTPAQKAGAKFPFRNWKEFVEQPYAVTSHIKLVPRMEVSLPKVKRARLSNKLPRVPKPKALKRVAQHYTRTGGGLTRRSDR